LIFNLAMKRYSQAEPYSSFVIVLPFWPG